MRRLNPLCMQGAVGIETATTRHNPLGGQRACQLGTGARMNQRNRRRAPFGPVRTEQADIIAPCKVVEQRLQQCSFMPAHQIMNRRIALRRRCCLLASLIAKMMAMQGVNIIGHPRTGRNLRMVRPGRGEAFVKRVSIKIGSIGVNYACLEIGRIPAAAASIARGVWCFGMTAS
ncbi:hypothetical protein BD293_1527 [Roseinatronobacter monicus]|uniref:Uncharacterized protein n=1 Tax=Roseinatronobacter monicus TaxID=393481 RepID=A0A543KCU5_9RHOB|nr:hypothetical protein BD293_1527 [Roseinatronobacter monicus]